MKNRYGLLILASLMFSQSVEAVDYTNAWFKPELEINESPVCEELLAHTTEELIGRAKNSYPDLFSKEDPYRLNQVDINNQIIYLSNYTHPGCGGACERYQLLTSSAPFPNIGESWDFYKEVSKLAPPAVSSYSFLSAGGNYYIYSPSETSNQLHQLQQDASWKKICTVTTKPSKTQIDKIQTAYQVTQSSLKELRGLVSGLRRGAGSCGSMRTHGRWAGRISEEFDRLLYAPRLKSKESTRFNDSRYEIDIKHLEAWSLQGLSEYEAFSNYKNALSDSTEQLSSFYTEGFGWEKAVSNEMADYALKHAISSGIRFYMYKPFKTQDEINLRKAILEKKPIGEIRKINLESTDKGESGKGESLLNLAVTYPEAMSYLLENGFNPNIKNAFDKTPLMYAAQYDGFEAAKSLIEAGAIVNTGTIIPNDNCSYTLRTSNMSPLHYAVRYSSKDIIDLLLSHDASIFFDVSSRAKYPETIEYPINWLDKYENERLSNEDKAQVRSSLELPSEAELVNLAKNLNLEGEKLYTEKQIQAAKERFQESIQVDNNIKALNNYALAALKLNDQKRSLQASSKVINSKESTDSQKSAAYFNTGLACEGAGKYGLRFDGRSYCRENTLEYFIKAFETKPSKSRANAIVKRFNKRDKTELACSAIGEEFQAFYKRGEKFYFLHKEPMAEKIDGLEGLFSNTSEYEVSRSKFSLKRISTFDLKNGYFVSGYQSGTPIDDTIAFERGVCSLLSARMLSEEKKLIYFHASNGQDLIEIDFDLNESYVIVLSGHLEWKINELGDKKSEFIISNGFLSDEEGISFTYIKNMHRPWFENSSSNQYISSEVRRAFGRPIFTKFKIVSDAKVSITDADINKPKLIVSSLPNLDFYGTGDYLVAFTRTKGAFKNEMNLPNIDMITADMSQAESENIKYEPNIEQYLNDNDNFYYRVKMWRRDYGRYFGDGYFKK